MQLTYSLLLLTGSAGLANCFKILPEVKNPSILSFNLHQQKNTHQADSKLIPQLNDFFYAFNLSIGTPPQAVSGIFDTGSRDFIINVVNSTLCEQGGCTENGAYNASASSTESWVADDMQVAYALGAANGSWVKDVININGVQIPKFQFGIQNFSANPQSYFGAGFPEDLSVSGPDGPKLTFLRTLVADKIIKSASEGFTLSDPSSVVFGGVDTSRFHGLVKFPIIPSDGSFDTKGAYDRVAINVSSVNGMTAGFRAMLDTGNFDIKLPKTIVDPIWAKYNVQGINIGGTEFGLAACSLNKTNSTVDFKFKGFEQQVPMSTIIYDPPASLLAAFGAGPLPDGTCIFGINPWNPDDRGIPYILGRAFLRNVYTIVNEGTHEVGLAHLNKHPGQPCIQEIS